MWKGFMFFLRQGWKYDRRYVVYLFLNQLVNAVTPIAAALLPRMVIDELTGLGRMGVLIGYVSAFSMCILLCRALTAFFSKAYFTHRCHVDAAFGFELHERLAHADIENLESPEFNDLKTRAQKFLTCDYHGFGYLLDCGAGILGCMLTLCGLLAILSTLEIWLLLLFVLLASVSSAIGSRATKKAMSLSMEVVENSRRWMYYAELFEQAKYGKEIRLNSMTGWLLGRERQVVERANNCIKQQNDCYIVSGIKRAGLSFVQQCMAYCVLIVKVLAGSLNIGSFAMCISAVTSFSDAMRELMDRLTEIRAYDFYYAQLEEYLNVPQTLRLSSPRMIPVGAHRFEFCNVGFRYRGSDSWALRGINLVLEPRQRLALVGENGSGKSTLIKLLCRMYAPTEGVILMDGVDISEYDYDMYMSIFATVFQDYQLFDCSLKDNILLGQVEDAKRLNAAVDQSGLRERVASLPRGLDSTVGHRFDSEGFEPSGGEGQKIALARALYRDAPVIVLDEPAAAMDPRAETEMYLDFARMTNGKSAIYISHRLSACRFCDCIAVLHQGKLIEYGNHDELMAQSGHYADLFEMQAQYYVQ